VPAGGLGTAEFDRKEGVPVPAEFVATIENRYTLPSTKPVNVVFVGTCPELFAVTVFVFPSGVVVKVYDIIGEGE
jgi:hypothetical protein